MTNKLNFELLNRIKDQVSKELYGIPDFNELVQKFTRDRKLVPLNVSDEVCRRYAEEVNKELNNELSKSDDLIVQLQYRITEISNCEHDTAKINSLEAEITELNKWVGDLQKQKEKLSEINVKLEAEITRLKEMLSNQNSSKLTKE